MIAIRIERTAAGDVCHYVGQGRAAFVHKTGSRVHRGEARYTRGGGTRR